MYKDNYSEETGGELDYILNSPDGFEEAREAAEKKPTFPVFVFFVAIIKDIVDVMFLGTLGVFIAPIAIFILFIWLMGKGSFIKKYFVKRYLYSCFHYISTLRSLCRNKVY